MTNLQDALGELEHVNKLGLKGAMLGIFPSGKGHPTPQDDAFWQAALDMQMPLCVHQESEYPHSHTVVAQNFAGVPADETSQMVAGNVITFFHLETSPE